jgi:hypothetical protein
MILLILSDNTNQKKFLSFNSLIFNGMKFKILILFTLAILCCLFMSCKNKSQAPKSTARSFAGTYSFGNNAEKEPVGIVDIYPTSDSTVTLYINATTGPPSFNSGSLYTGLKVINGRAIYYSKQEGDTKGCKWDIALNDSTVVIKTLDGCYECGFGGNVIADNVYKCITHKVPVYFISGEGDTVYYKSLKF